jgi:hypothetical protein
MTAGLLTCDTCDRAMPAGDVTSVAALVTVGEARLLNARGAALTAMLDQIVKQRVEAVLPVF